MAAVMGKDNKSENKKPWDRIPETWTDQQGATLCSTSKHFLSEKIHIYMKAACFKDSPLLPWGLSNYFQSTHPFSELTVSLPTNRGRSMTSEKQLLRYFVMVQEVVCTVQSYDHILFICVLNGRHNKSKNRILFTMRWLSTFQHRSSTREKNRPTVTRNIKRSKPQRPVL